MLNTIIENIRKQRLAWSWAVIVGLFLVVLGHAPVLPVIAGCALAIALSTLRGASHSQPPAARLRGGR